MLRTVIATRYVEPLREGGSVPAIIEADDDGMYVVKFRGAGQGPKALVAELLGGEIGRALDLPVPELVLVELDEAFGRAERDPEIQIPLKASAGLNLALDYLPGSFMFDPTVPREIDPALASKIVWFDTYITNPDRTVRNPNILSWHGRLWLIDHGASLGFHHRWSNVTEESPRARGWSLSNHVLGSRATRLAIVDMALAGLLDRTALESAVGAVPAEYLSMNGIDTHRRRAAYVAFLWKRLKEPRPFLHVQ